MNILMPMAGAGQRFRDAGYTVAKPALPTTDRRTGKFLPMAAAAARGLPGVLPDGENLIFVERTEQRADGTEKEITACFPRARFLVVDHLTEGQASTCLLAKALINTEEELLIAGCDNDMIFDEAAFEKAKADADVLVFTYRHNEAVLSHPNAYGWCRVDDAGTITGMSIKKAISETPMEDHAVVATFWFRRGVDFVAAAERMIAADDRIRGEFYVDETIMHAMATGCRAKVFEITRYIGWGTPTDYEAYQKTLAYWKAFVDSPKFLGRD